MRTTLTLVVGSVALGLCACAGSPSIDPYSRYERGAEPLSERDALITSTIRAQFASDPQVDSSDIGIDTYRGTVELSGVVDDRDDIRRAVRIALATPGVRSVRNDMRVGR